MAPYQLAYLSFLAAIILYTNTVSIIKKVHKEEITTGNTIIGCVCLIIILVTIYTICD